MILSDDESIDDRMECNGDYVKPREGDLGNVEDATSGDNFCDEWMQQTVVFMGDKVKSSTHIRCRWQNILTKLPEITDQARNVTTLLETWNCHNR
jgi:hypothetical protein